MISVYSIGNSEYTKNGDAVLHPTSCTVREVAGGSYEATLEHPITDGGEWEYLADGAIIKVPVPVPTIENAFVGQDVDVYRTTASADVREGPSEPTRITYSSWTAGGSYSVGSKVTNSSYDNHNYKCIAYDSSSALIMVPPNNNSAWWTRIPDYTSGSALLTTLAAGTEVYLVEQTSTTWYKISTKYGITGYAKARLLEFVRSEHVEPVEPRTIEDQLFRIYKVTTQTEKKTLTVNAKHVSYDLSGVLLGDCNIALAEPAMAIMRIKDAYMIPYAGEIATNLTSEDNGTYTGNVSGKNGTYAFLDPDKGMIPHFRAKLIRDNWDLFLMKNDLTDRGYRMTYGVNMRGVTWTKDIGSQITRVVPVAKAADGSELYLPETWVDSEYIDSWPVIKMEQLKVQGQVGKDDGTGTGTNWTEATLWEEMRTKAGERFSVDHADAENVQLTVDFTMLGNTAEYQQYKDLQKLYLYDVVRVEDPRVGLDIQLQVSEYEWDAIREKYTGIKVGSVFDYGGRTVTGYQIGEGAIYYEKIAQSTIDQIISEVQ